MPEEELNFQEVARVFPASAGQWQTLKAEIAEVLELLTADRSQFYCPHIP